MAKELIREREIKTNNVTRKKVVPSNQKEIIIEKLMEKGCRITKQRLTLLDIILTQDCSSCKEIFYQASKKDSSIGAATVYRMVNILEEIGAIDRKNMYKINCADCVREESCTVVLDDDTTYHLSAEKWNTVILEGLKACGYLSHQEIESIVVMPEPRKELNILSG